MAKSAKTKVLEEAQKKAIANKEQAIHDSQIQVYENQRYEAVKAYNEAKARRATARSRLPKEIPDDPAYKEKLMEAQYIKSRLRTPEHVEQVDAYEEEIKTQQRAKKTVSSMDSVLPTLYTEAVQEADNIDKAVAHAKTTSTATQNALITSYDTQIKAQDAKEKAEAKAIADKERAEAKALADERQARADKFYAEGNDLGKTDSKRLHYSLLGGTIQRGDIVPVKYASAGRSGTGVDISERYYKEAAKRLGITLAQAHEASRIGAVTQSGKARESYIRSVQDPSGKKEADYQASRAQAKKNVASA
jgi:hypothetical protein